MVIVIMNGSNVEKCSLVLADLSIFIFEFIDLIGKSWVSWKTWKFLFMVYKVCIGRNEVNRGPIQATFNCSVPVQKDT